MGAFEVVRHTDLPATTAWARLTDWTRHGDLIPFTTVTTSAAAGVGATFMARTSVGPLGFDDPMEVTRWEPATAQAAGFCRIEKRGRMLRGWAEITVTPTPSGSKVVWREEAGFGGVGRLLDLPNRVAGRWVFGRLVDGLLARP